ncbi:MAG: sigma-54-dependent Fis family transcriptional regulator [Planctomyces sp.]|nr:sigma-54-dependent Fis family transcriptional regulator [Planctomyces sp.]
MKILIADDEAAARYGMSRALAADGRELIEAEDGGEALSKICELLPDLVFLDLNMPVRDGLCVLDELRRNPLLERPEIIVVTANDSVEQAVECIRRGASDFMTKPFEVEQVRAIARRAQERVRLQQRVQEMQEQLELQGSQGSILGVSRPVKKLLSMIERAARSELPVLLRGESGTGKELVARELHNMSSRRNGPFIAVNTAAIADSLSESELFGHVRGAFTGADRAREGVFKAASGGTLFLDEIGDMSASVQTRLLRVLQEGLIQPVGATDPVRVDVRIISATHQDLEQAIVDRAFRQDLYFRLKGIELHLPPLRSRQEDILLLARTFLGGERYLSAEAVTALLQYAFPGNVRELKQMMQAAAAMTEPGEVTPLDLGLGVAARHENPTIFAPYADLPLAEGRQRLLEDFERFVIGRALEQEQNNISGAARLLGMHRQSLQQKMRQLGIR